MLSKLGRWTTIAAVAVGYALVHGFTFGFLVSSYYESGRQRLFEQPFVQRADVSVEGQLRYVRVNSQTSEMYTTPTGESLPYAPGPELLPVIREQYSSSPNYGPWADRLATFETTSAPDVVWTLVVEQESPKVGVYFTAVQRSSRKTLGHLGSRGFQANAPQASELILWDIQMFDMYSLVYRLQLFRTSTPPTLPVQDGGTATASFDRWPIISNGKLLTIDFVTKTIDEHPEFGECQSITWAAGSNPRLVQVGRFSPPYIPVLIQKDKLIFDPLGNSKTVVLPERLHTRSFQLFAPQVDRIAIPDDSPRVAIEGQIRGDRKIHVTRFSESGQIISEEDHQLPPLPYQHLLEHDSRKRIVFGSLAIPVPVVWLVVSYWEPSWALPIAGISAVLGLACLLGISRWRKFPWTRGHVAAAVIVGPAAAMTLWAIQRSRPNEELAPAPLNGCEVFG